MGGHLPGRSAPATLTAQARDNVACSVLRAGFAIILPIDKRIEVACLCSQSGAIDYGTMTAAAMGGTDMAWCRLLQKKSRSPALNRRWTVGDGTGKSGAKLNRS